MVYGVLPCKMDGEKDMNSPGIVFVFLSCLVICVFILLFILALCETAKMADKDMEKELKKQMNFEEF